MLAEERIVENEHGYPAFLVRIVVPEDAWEQNDGRPGFVRFDVIEIDGWHSITNGERDGYGEQSLVFTDEEALVGGTSSDPETALVFAQGTVKWDGCVNWSLEPTNSVLAHACDAPGLRASLSAISLGYALAARRTIPSKDFVSYSGLPA